MVRRVAPLAIVVVAVVLAACNSQITEPIASGQLLRDLDEPECVDTVYEERAARTNAALLASHGSSVEDGDSDSPGCHVVVVWY